MFLRFIILVSAFLCSLSSYAASGLKDVELRDLYFGEILYYAYQDLHFDALAKLDAELSQYYELDESELDSLHMHLGQAEFSVGDIELQYRMNQRAGKAIQAVLGEGIDLAIRNQAALALARVFYRKNDAAGTLYALDLIREEPDKSRYEKKYSLDVLRGREPETFKTDVAYLRALASIDTGQFSEAVKILQSLREEKTLEGFVLYNLGIALIQSGREQEAVAVLDELGRLETDDDGLLAIKDKTNLKLAYRFLDKGDAKQAQKYFERVRLDGPYSNKALLGAGWIAVAQDRFDRALVPWSMLHQRAETNYSVQEVLMAVPYAYGKLQAYGKAANLYDHAMDVFAREISSLDDSIKSIRTGKFLAALLDEKSDKDKNWVVNLRELPDTPETRYILELMASHDFQSSYRNYKDLAELRHHLDKWLADLRVYEEMIEIRRVYQEPLLPVVEEKFKKVDAKIKLRLEQRDSLAKKIKNMLISSRPEYLATSDERQVMDRVIAIEEYIKAHPGEVDEALQNRIKRLHGVLSWRVESEYDQRLTDAYNHLSSLDEIIKELKIRYHSFIRTRQAATQSYEGYTIPIRQLRTRLFAVQRKLKGVMAKQGRLLETMAINELDRRRKRLEEYQIKARFALAESYDRATKAQTDAEIEKQRQLQNPQQGPNTNEAVPQEEVIEKNKAEDVSLTDPIDEVAAEAAPESVTEPSSFKEKLRAR
ncbi:MAG: tetratricopeptide repeat protein [Gammaproteobacteria bacterium]